MKPFEPPKLPPLAKKKHAPTPLKTGLLANVAADALSNLRAKLKLDDGDVDSFAAELKERAEQDAAKHRRLLDIGESVCRDLRSGGAKRFLEDVVRPMQRREIGGRDVAKRTNNNLGRNVLSEVQGLLQQITVQIGLGASIGCMFGYEKTYGVAFTGMPGDPRAFECWSRTLHVGTVELSVAGSIEFSVGPPEPKTPAFLAESPLLKKSVGWDGWTLGWSVGGGYGATFGRTLGYEPNFLTSPLTWPLKSIEFEFGGGGGVDLGLCLQGTVACELPKELVQKTA